ncbi:hypothetical protein IWW48_005973 [Coemansia sp. RSA 1200]|nr:hypothetical protein IWW48_005973 [Coemansia sp. RSA 1200]
MAASNSQADSAADNDKSTAAKGKQLIKVKVSDPATKTSTMVTMEEGSDTKIFCFNNTVSRAERGFLTADPAGPLVGRLDCIELMTKAMAQAELTRRTREKNKWVVGTKGHRVEESDVWANRWGLRWILRLRHVVVLGNEGITDLSCVRDGGFCAPTDAIMRPMFRMRGKSMMNAYKATTMDEAVVDWAKAAREYVGQKVLGPGIRAVDKYVESWRDGTMKALVHRLWADVVTLGAWKSASKTIERVMETSSFEGKSKKP